VDAFGDVLTMLDRMKSADVIADYAVGGAMAVSFWTEPVATQDLDVVVTTAGESGHALDPLRRVLEWVRMAGIQFEGEHAIIAGVPVQFLVAWNPLVEEAVARASTVAYDPADPVSPTLRLIPPTYLVAMWTVDRAADTPRRRARSAMLREAGLVDETLLESLLTRFGS
jgi:hypothetical protein